MHHIGSVAKLTGNNIETIRYYEKIGLLPEPKRGASGYRQYPDTTIKRLQFIKAAKALGFTLSDIKELLELRADSAASCASVQAKAKTKLLEVENKIRVLSKIMRVLQSLADECRVEKEISYCPILNAMSEEDFHL